MIVTVRSRYLKSESIREDRWGLGRRHAGRPVRLAPLI